MDSEGAHSYIHNGRVIYKWDQTLTDVNIYIEVPEGVRAKQLTVQIAPRHLTVGIQGNPPYLDDGVLQIQLTKAEEASTWASAIAGHEVDSAQREADQKRLMLERFQQEHPGFDFSGAEFTGAVPDPRTFMKDLDQQQHK